MTEEELRVLLRALRESSQILMAYPRDMNIRIFEWSKWYHAMEDAEEVRLRLMQRRLDGNSN